MGDQVAVRKDRHASVASAHELPEGIDSESRALATLRRASLLSKRLDAATDVALDPGSSHPESECSDLSPRCTDESLDGRGGAPSTGWRILRDSEAWKDKNFMRTLRHDVERMTSSGESEGSGA